MSVERISLSQVTMLIVISRISLTLVFFGTPPGVDHDVWWQSFFTIFTGIGCLWLCQQLWKRAPGLTLFQVMEATLGRPIGKAINLLYLLFFLLMLSLNLRLVGEFFLYAFLPRTPNLVVTCIVTALAVWAARAGIEVIARAGEVIFPLLIGSIVLIFTLLLKDLHLEQLMPLVILRTGPLPHLQDMVSVAARTVEIAWLGLLVPHLDQPQRLLRAAVKAQFWQGALWVIMGITIVGVLGREIQSHYFPFFAAARLVEVADFLERIDAVFLAVWLFGMFLRVALLLWASAVGAAEVMGLRSYRSLVMPLAGLGITYSIGQADTFSELQGYLAPEVFTPFGLLFVLLFPLIALVALLIRRKRGAPVKGGAQPVPPAGAAIPPWQPPT